MKITQDQLLSMTEAAAHLKLRAKDSSLPAVFTRLGKRGLKAIKTGRERQYLKSHLDEFIHSQIYGCV